jgi:hypothetical protein
MVQEKYGLQTNYKLNKKLEGKLGGIWVTMYDKKSPMGRFGGGVQLSLGIDIAKYGTVMFNLIFVQVGIWFTPLQEYLINRRVEEYKDELKQRG